MTLRQGCELWATFDAEDVDPNRGIVRDRSGKGRTLEASGGPTFGQSSPVGEAVGFDGTDDFLDPQLNTPISSGGHTLAALIRTRDIGDGTKDVVGTHNFGDNTGFGFAEENGGSALAYTVGGFGNNIFFFYNSQSYFFFIGRYDGNVAQLFTDGDFIGESTVTAPNYGNDFFVGTSPNGRFFGGSIGFVGLWSRALSDSEIEELNRMTDRMVSRL